MKRGARTLWDCRYHVVWCPKYRKDLFKDVALRQYVWELFEQTGKELEVEIQAMEVAEDHVHLLMDIPPKLSVAETVRRFKSISAREAVKKFLGIRKRLWGGELWNDGYFVRSVGSEVTSEIITNYIREHGDKDCRSPAQLRLNLQGQPKRASDSPRLAPG